MLVSYARFGMKITRPHWHRVRLLAFAVPLVLVATACLDYPATGAVTTPGAPSDTSAQSRLPQLLSQFQGGNSDLSLFDGTTNDVLAETDQTPSGKDGTVSTPVATQTVAGATTPGPSTATPTPTTSGSLPLEPGTTTPTPTPTASPTAPAATATATPTPTLVPTATPTSGPPAEGSPPTEGGSSGGDTPPTEG